MKVTESSREVDWTSGCFSVRRYTSDEVYYILSMDVTAEDVLKAEEWCYMGRLDSG